MKPKSGKKIEAIKPTKPEEAFVADEAEPGKVAKVKAKQVDASKGKYGKTKISAFKPIESSSSSEDDKSASKGSQKSTKKNSDKKEEKKEEEKKTTHISIKLTDEKGNAIAGESFEIELPDGSVSKGTVDIDGTAKVDGIEAGQCKVRFPNLEDDSVSLK